MHTIGLVTVLLSLAVTSLGLTAQVRKNHARRSVDGLSLMYFVLLAVSYTFWVVYGIVRGDWVLIVPMSVDALMSWVVVVQFYLFRPHKDKS